jgi:hypothetical protein
MASHKIRIIRNLRRNSRGISGLLLTCYKLTVVQIVEYPAIALLLVALKIAFAVGIPGIMYITHAILIATQMLQI